jgi:hypothetical protein
MAMATQLDPINKYLHSSKCLYKSISVYEITIVMKTETSNELESKSLTQTIGRGDQLDATERIIDK